jgi:hypothetical protein
VNSFSSAGRADDLPGLDDLIELILREAVDIDVLHLGFDQIIRAETGVAVLAVDERIMEIGHMSGRFPDLRIHDDGGIDLDVVFDAADEVTEPELLHVVLEQGA